MEAGSSKSASPAPHDHEIAGDAKDEPLQLIEFVKNDSNKETTIQIRMEVLKNLADATGSRPVAIISIAGKSRMGKSTMLGYITRSLRSLEHRETFDWRNNENQEKSLQGFKFRSGTKPETKGIWVWSRPFIIRNANNEEIAVILIDSQGTQDRCTSVKDMSAIVGLTLLMSSITIFNCALSLQEDALSSLITYTHYGRLALEATKTSPFQRLMFLIRDWNTPGEHEYGSAGGQNYLEELLQINDNDSFEANEVRGTIRSCFSTLGCYLMPCIGEAAKQSSFKGRISELSKEFAIHAEKFVNELTENLVTKQFMGRTMTLQGLLPFVEGYVRTFNSTDVPSAEQMWQTDAALFNDQILDKAADMFDEVLKRKSVGYHYLSKVDLEKALTLATKKAEEHFQQAKIIGTEEKKLELSVSLNKMLKNHREDWQSQNADKRKLYISTAIETAVLDFQSELDEDAPLKIEGCNTFYDEPYLQQKFEHASEVANQNIRKSLALEDATKILKVEALLNIRLKNIKYEIKKQSKANREETENFLQREIDRLQSKFEQAVETFLEKNRYAEKEELWNVISNHKANCKQQLLQIKNLGNEKVFEEFNKKMCTQIQKLGSDFSTKHDLSLKVMDKLVKDRIENQETKYAQFLSVTLKSIANVEKWQEAHRIHAENIMKHFVSKKYNPYPLDCSQHKKLNEQLNHRLEGVYTKAKTQEIEYRRRCSESNEKAIRNGMVRYKENMDNAMATGEGFYCEDQLAAKHQTSLAEGLRVYNESEKFGTAQNLAAYLQDLHSEIEKEFLKYKETNDLKKSVAIGNAEKLVSTCLISYEEKMTQEMDSVRTTEKLNRLHEQSLTFVMEKFKTDTLFISHPSLANEYESKLHENILETFIELADIFHEKEESATKEMLVMCCKRYNEEMQKHCKNTQFIRPLHLNELHDQASRVSLRYCHVKTPLTDTQRLHLKEELENFYVKYRTDNSMKLNFLLEDPPAIGIDLGTTYCCVAVYYNGDVIIIPNHLQGDSETTASYVRYDVGGPEMFGNVAKQTAYECPGNTIYDAKRILGRKFNDPVLQADMKFWPFKVELDDGKPKVRVHDKLYHPEEVSAYLLKQLKLMAERHLKLKENSITKAVVTVPAYFNDGQRQATKDAAELAGFKEVSIFNEPTAAAIAYSLERLDNEPRKVLIFDMGGGTFDVAVLDVSPTNIDVLGVHGNSHLGGQDFDNKLVELCAKKFREDTGIDLLMGRNSSDDQEKAEAQRRLLRLQIECEKEKRVLSTGSAVFVTLDAIYNGIDLHIKITRDEFERENEIYFQEALNIVEKALKETKLKKEQIDDIVLVGGSTRIPRVQQMLSDYFGGSALNYSINPDQAVAYGAAVKAAMINGEQAQGKINFTNISDVTPFPLGVEIVTKELSVIVPKNTKVPKKLMRPHFTVRDNQTRVRFQIYQGEHRIAAKNELLGEFMLNGIPSKKAGKEPIDVSMEIDEMGILHVEAVVRSTKGAEKIKLEEYRHKMSVLTKEKIRESLRQQMEIER